MVPQTKQAADPATIRADLEYMTARWHELPEAADMEIRALAEGLSPQVQRFQIALMDEAVEFAVSMNRLGRNIYAVRNPIRATANVGKGATDADILAAFFLWADCDDPTSEGNVRRFDGPRVATAVVTGREPFTRVHTYWELLEPCYDLAAWRETQSAIAAHFGSDRQVINPSRIMRVAGTISHPAAHKRAKGYVPEICTIRHLDGAAPVPFEQLSRVFAGAATPQQTATALHIDTGGHGPSLDRSEAQRAALSGENWHQNMVRLVGSYVGRGLSDDEIHALTDALTLPGYTVDQTRREVQTAIDGARRKGWTPEPQEYATLAPEQAAAPVTNDDGLEWFDHLQPSLGGAYIVKGMLDEGTMSVVYGPSNSGKTFFAIDLAFHVAIGAEWRGRRVTPAGVLYLAAEGGRGIINRVVALREEYGVASVPLAVKRAGLDLLRAQADLQAIVDLATTVRAKSPDGRMMIVIDTLSRVMAGGDENSAQDMTALIRNIDAIRARTGAHIMLVHHTGKDSARGARGHSSLRAATDTEIEVAPPSEDGAPRMAMVTKQRDHNGGETFAFGLKSVTLGIDQDGDEVVTCILEPVDDEAVIASAQAKKGLGGSQKIILEAFDQLVAEGLCRPNPGGVGMPEIGQFTCVSREDLRSVSMGKMSVSDSKSSFNKAMAALIEKRGILCAGGNLVWRTDRKNPP